MGSRVTFRGRDARGVAKVSRTYYEPELVFVKFTPEELEENESVGNGTQYCMKVTRRQLEALLYRVKETAFDPFFINTHYDSGYSTTTLDFTHPGDIANPANRYAAVSDGVFDCYVDRRGWVAAFATADELVAALGANATYFSEPYEPAFEVYADMVDEFGRFAYGNGQTALGSFFPPAPTSGKSFVTSVFLHPDPPSIGVPYSYFKEVDNTSGTIYAEGYIYAELWALIGAAYTSYTECAFVDHAGNGDPLDPANELWLEADIAAYADATSGAVSLKDYTVTPIPVGEYTFDFGAGSGLEPVIVQLYSPSDNFIVSGPIFITHRATEWWPYAKPDGTDQWDTINGKPSLI